MKIPYQKYTFTLEAVELLYLPYYKGSTFRGGFGNVFKKIACPLRFSECKDCILRENCVYVYIFETIPNEKAQILNMNKYEKIPHPFIIEPPENTENLIPVGQTITFNLILIGRAIDYIPYFIYVFEELGKIGIGKGRGKYKLQKVQVNEQTIYKKGILKKIPSQVLELPVKFKPSDKKDILKIKIYTPVRIKYQRKFCSELDFHILIRNLLRRLTLLSFFHCSENPDIQYKEMIFHAENVRTLSSNLSWYDWERYSTRQETRMKLGGVIGEITYEGDITPFMPYLRAGEIFHIGKGTSFGLGKYQIIK
ncbi:MAG: CRISPR system precrRNA processing endoribonuclease RAMP protein Cas6 [Thermodesulfovibrio sp.]|uniref:CRISPR system precrRNA processing endoribonuclease RAMP protein Cas6 n=1 Tax=unclassified Thermodesulfovibrio TaxID=2645936 RepID=UPI00083B02AD|nr:MULTISPECIES: CRISPR system precrRNA processing endoribonuclease RAMP protein Cas6 [unclassified Thermodesulfovibrio]MDI1471295.1 CRISPR system precrRNA processing endoribonuclease RAMP protein Cas6 [Thermodesulfovibrio sp. 1176]MDI6714701.1 CRISPR system precrRNA processing endoribonuclease RAMP protein Cas6 [Thermodesulfovibrio sp.]ODA43433.1 CRISPR repeat RNA endoribonuclease Cas6 [Thermodesulfovibrio sp. N1]